ncbi:DUF748 domain-containing protein [Porifericola rhodea]|uniref:DUF748 domain-containing protein n=1 Tax=Porifericola rhodea TaxID=930972 RepID=UPI002666C42C|nr:DUF748 domain-containing protein [Porifericola rhodea]WKN31739.1 DUF748 domain-containing protein [Porifericola rhodea]
MKKRWITLLIIVGIIILIRLLLEPVAEHYVNRELNKLEHYSGSIADVDIRLYRGAYKIKGIEINKISNEVEKPFVSIDTMDLSVQWDALLKGSIVGEILVINPKVNMVVTPTVEDDSTSEQTGAEEDWTQTVQNLIPLTINRFEIKSGRLSYFDPNVNPEVDIYLHELNLLIENISNVNDSTDKLPSSLKASAVTVGNGEISLDMQMNVLKEMPDLNANFELKNLDLTSLNDFIKAYANFDVHAGTFTTITELQLTDGQLDGYIKPFFDNLDVFSLEEDLKDDKGFFGKAWEALVGLGAESLENQPQDQVATRIPIQGSLDKMDPDISKTVWNILRNAFVDAFEKEFERRAKADTN